MNHDLKNIFNYHSVLPSSIVCISCPTIISEASPCSYAYSQVIHLAPSFPCSPLSFVERILPEARTCHQQSFVHTRHLHFCTTTYNFNQDDRYILPSLSCLIYPLMEFVDHVLGRPSVQFRKIQVLAVVSFWSFYLFR